MKVGSVLNIVKSAVPELMKSDFPRIVIINGVTVNVPEPDMAAVSVSRASVKQAAHMLASVLKKRNPFRKNGNCRRGCSDDLITFVTPFIVYFGSCNRYIWGIKYKMMEKSRICDIMSSGSRR